MLIKRRLFLSLNILALIVNANLLTLVRLVATNVPSSGQRSHNDSELYSRPVLQVDAPWTFPVGRKNQQMSKQRAQGVCTCF